MMKMFGRMTLAFAVSLMTCSSFAAAISASKYDKVMEITVSGYTGGSTLTDFPVLVKLSASIDGFLYSDMKLEGGADLRFALEDGTLLASEVDTWNTAGTSLVWVRIPSFAKDAKIYAYYGSTEPDAVTASEVWSADYAGVYHLGESAVPLKDSSGKVTDFTKAIGSGIKYASTGVLGGAVDFGETNKSRGLQANDADAFDGMSAMTIEIWSYQASHATSAIVVKRNGYNNETSWQLYDGGGWTTFGIDVSSNGNSAKNVNLITPTTGAWAYQVYTYDSTLSTDRTKGYLNGTFAKADNTLSGSVRSGSAPVFLGIFAASNDARNFPGKLDEFRISRVARSADWVKASYDTVSTADFLSFGPVKNTDVSLPVIGSTGVARNADGSFTVSAVVADNAPPADSVFCVIGESAYAMTTEDTSLPLTYAVTLADLPAGVTLRPTVRIDATATKTVSQLMQTSFYTGDLTIEKVADASEGGLVAGSFRVTRADTDDDLVVGYTVSGTAVPDQTYTALSGTVTIPAGAASADIVVQPLFDSAVSEDATVTLALNAGTYGISATAGLATLTIANLSFEAGWNTWIAATPGLASDDANWSEGHAPTAEEKVLFDGRFSNAKCTWNAEATHTVAAWRQKEGYTATVEFNTEFPTYEGATFPLFTVTGDVEILSGGWTCRGNYNNYGAATESNTSKLASKRWCLNAEIGGDLTIASGAKIDVTGRGFGHPGNQSSPCYGGYTFTTTQSCAPYGSITEPFDPGMGCRSQGDQNSKRSGTGGGAVKLVVAGEVTVDGSILAVGTVDLNIVRSGGTGGSIWIDAKQISGSGVIRASACPPSPLTSDQGVAIGSGGRIALYTKSELAFPKAKIFCSGCAYRGTSYATTTKVGSAGTIFIKDNPAGNGTLLLKQEYDIITCNSANGAIPLMGDLTLDAIELVGRVVLLVPEGKTLTLPNGFASVTTTDTSFGANGISCRGGSIVFGTDDQTISGWMFEPTVAFAFPGNVTLAENGSIGIIRRNFIGSGDAAMVPQRVAFTVAGDLTIDATSAVDVGNALAYVHSESGAKGGWYGGWTTYYDKSGNKDAARTKTYGSVFNPTDAGNSPSRSFLTGGAVDFTVAGELALAGKVSASANSSDSTTDNIAPPSAGSIKMSVGSLTGTGSIQAIGGAGRYCYAGGGAGGRVAIRLTEAGATIPETITLNAQGRYGYAFNASANKLGSAGTIYVETKADGVKGGTIIVSNWKDHANADFTSATVIPTTPIVAAQDGDAVADFKKAKLVVRNNAIAEVSTEGLRLNAVMVDVCSSLELAGRTLTVAKATLGGVKLTPGTYKASDAALEGFVTDSSEAKTGTLVVTGGGIVIFVK